jgi:hypothetical protein
MTCEQRGGASSASTLTLFMLVNHIVSIMPLLADPHAHVTLTLLLLVLLVLLLQGPCL